MQPAGLFESQMAMYTSFHRDARNRATHFIGVPAIIVSLMVVLALARFRLGGLDVSWAIVVTVAVFGLWLMLDVAIGAAMAMFLVPSLVFGEWLAASYTAATAWWAFAILFVGGWAFQLWGHVYEGRRPALVSNLFQALIGPMFLMAEIFFALGWRRRLHDRVEAVISERYPDYAAAEGPRAEPAAE